MVMKRPVECRHITDKAEWERFMAGRDEANFLHSWNWGVFHQNLGKTVVRLGFYNNGTLAGICCGIVEDARRGRYLAVAGGPLIDWSDGRMVSAVFAALTEEARAHRCVFVRMRPQQTDTPELRRIVKQAGLRPAPMHLTADLTSQIDLSKSEDALLNSMRKTTRYEIRKAQSLGLTIQTSTDPAAIDGFYDMQMETAKRHGFVPFSRQFLTEQFKAFAADDAVVLYKVFNGTQLLAEAFVIFYGHEAAYHYGSSTDAARKMPGAYLIQWEAIKEAKKRGMKRYNLWGVVPDGVTDHRFSGVSVFKRGFGGQDVAYLPAHDLVINPVRYAFNYTVESIRHRLRRL